MDAWVERGIKDAEEVVVDERELREDEMEWAQVVWEERRRDFEEMMDGVEEELAELVGRLPVVAAAGQGKEAMVARWKFEATGGR